MSMGIIQWRPLRVLLWSLLPLAVGCNSIEKDHGADFLKPFASVESMDAQAKRQPIPDERSLCIETAKTVATKGHAEEAIKLFERAEELDPNASTLDRNLAPLYAEVGNHAAAIERYKLILQATPDDADLINNYAWTLMEAGRFDQAIEEAMKGLQKSPENKRLRSTLAMTYYRQGDHGNAFQQWEMAVGKTAALHNLALLDIEAGEIDSARKNLQRAKQDPNLDDQTNALVAALETSTQQR
ncbi:TPR Domain containing protein [Rhodopirellula islandica]|uniref:TPR Domain containing protein n=1 Tax=Rhodopirellula islandica TaxID=595434 RepID=A0A0J1BHR7_RHOIS|nr:tetratricopeptide repeat protein [Rhodopirellula islandica]KLU06086.1 TPR Domain containing protein [Rhodopirellula islandica]